MLRWFKTLMGAPGTPPDAPETAAPTLLVGLPFEMISVPGHEAVQAWEKLRGRPGQTPIILGGHEDVQPMVESFEGDTKSAQQVLADAAQIDPKRWLREQYDADPDLYAVEPAVWPKAPGEQRGLSAHLDAVKQRPKGQVLIALMPTANAWEVPAFLRYGGWNDCPPPEVHAALHRRWHEKWGAEIACMAGDVVECVVARPPATREEAMKLAREQFVYCPDIVHQGVQSLEALANLLQGGKTWYFWWD